MTLEPLRGAQAHQLEITQVYERSEREVLTGLIGGRQ